MKRLIATFIALGIIISTCTYMIFYLLDLNAFLVISIYIVIVLAYLLFCHIIFSVKSDAAYAKTCSMLSSNFRRITKTNKFPLDKRIRNFKYARARMVFNEIEIEFILQNKKMETTRLFINTNDYLWFTDNFKVH